MMLRNGLQQGTEKETIGAKLSQVIGCAIHYPAYEKNMYQCRCGTTFPYYIVSYAYNQDSWEDVLRMHREGNMKYARWEEDTD